jgi:hypothetical protein
VQQTCAWSQGNTCTDWCDNGACYYDDVLGKSVKNQVCCVGHPSDTQVVNCDGSPIGGDGESWYSPICSFDHAGCDYISGWACDQDNYSQQNQLEIWIHGWSGLTYPTQTKTANTWREDDYIHGHPENDPKLIS